MAMKIQGGLAPWLSRLEARRDQLGLDVEPKPSPLGDTFLAKGLVDAHGAHLAGFGEALRGLALHARKLAPHQKKQLGLAIKKLSSLVEAQLSSTPEVNRRAVADALGRDFRGLVERAGTGPSALPAIYAALGIYDASLRAEARGTLQLTPAERAQTLAEAIGQVRALRDRLSGVEGLPSALNLYAVLVERRALDQAPATFAALKNLAQNVAAALAGADGPYTPTRIAELAEQLGGAPLAPAVAGPPEPRAKGKLGLLHPRVIAQVRRATAGHPSALEATIEQARRLGPDATEAALTQFAANFEAASGLIAARPALAPEDTAIANTLAIHAPAEPRFEAILDLAVALKTALGGAAIAGLLPGGPDETPGLMTLLDPASDYRNPPELFLPRLLAAPALTPELAKIAIQIASQVGRLGHDPGSYGERIVADFSAAAEQGPCATPGGSPLATRAGGQAPSLAAFQAAHPLIPAELIPTAAVHLSPEALAYLDQRLESGARSLEVGRRIRDFVFGSIDAGHGELVTIVAQSPSPPKAIQKAIAEIARAFKTNTLGALAIDAISEGLRAGRDPIADLERAQDGAALKIDLVELTQNRLDPKGREEIMAAAERTNYLLGIYVPGGPTYDGDVDMGALGAIFKDALRSVAIGTWPAPKYESSVGQRMMAALPGDVAEVWKSVLVTPAIPAGEAPTTAVKDAMNLLAGLRVALPEAITLVRVGALPLGWDRASLENLQALRDDVIEQLRAHPKGSDEHRGQQRILGELNPSLALLELHQALAATAAEASPEQVLPRIRPALLLARRALTERGGVGFAEAVDQILHASAGVGRVGRAGRYAIDEDSYTALVCSNTSGCLSPHWNGDAPGRQWGLAGALCDANIRMLRVMDGDKQLYRGFLKFFPASFPGYQGPVLWLDPPKADGGGDSDDLRLFLAHAIQKALRMGIPVTMGQATIEGSLYQPEILGQIGASLGLKVESPDKIKIFADEGATGFMHSDSLMNGKGNIRAGRGDQPTWNIDVSVNCVVMPHGVA